MEILLVSVTVVSLVLALVMSVIAWRLSRQERERSSARVAALATVAHAAQPPGDTVANPPAPLAAPSAPWSNTPRGARSPARQHRDEQSPLERQDDREPALELKHHGVQSVERPRNSAPGVVSDVGDSFLGSAVAAPASDGRQRALAIAASILFVILVTAGYVAVFGDDRATGAAAATSAPAAPLELISLRHERKAGGLAITGLVRNPSAGQALDKLAAVVFLFDQQGGFITSSRAGVDYTQLTPGDESPFVIRVEAPSNVARYRVSFRTEAGVVPHVDRRGQEPIAGDLP
jgi:hypothetical protein